jgi:hypothetical protein
MDALDQVKETYEKYSDVMYLEMATTPDDAAIETVEVGESVGFPGQIVVRVDSRSGVLYGVTIERFSAVKRQLVRDERKKNIQAAIRELIERIIEVLHSGIVPTLQASH